ncbi:MAG: ribose 5-phosphate isomerase B [Alphaproteobacteria bacterium]|nr:ribose 5-phosphate isomerase B [Alphaproteobacteria bacterium]
MEKIAIASDHGGYALKEAIKERFSDKIEFLDLGTTSGDSVDYPEFGAAAGNSVLNGDAVKAIVICGTGIGISIAANRKPGVRAALCTDVTMARLTRQHNDANILALGARITGEEVAMDIVETFLNTKFEGGRHARRVEKLG